MELEDDGPLLPPVTRDYGPDITEDDEEPTVRIPFETNQQVQDERL